MTNRKTVAHTAEGMGIDEITLTSGTTQVSLLTLGAVTRDWRVSHSGRETSVVLGHPDAADYIANPNYFGAIAGRIANRVAGGKFTLDGITYQCSQNEGENMLHGGHIGLARRMFEAQVDSADNSVLFSYHSPDGEEGFPGAVDFSYKISLNGTKVIYELVGTPDRPTPINLAQHNYYNLMGQGDIREYALFVDADMFTPTGEGLIPTGEIASVDGTPLDFRESIEIAQADPAGNGMDVNLVLRGESNPTATVTAPNGLRLALHTQEAGLQVYTGTYLAPQKGQNRQDIGKFSGLCLEPQQFPNSVNQSGFEAKIATPDAPYTQTLTVDISE
ncbi:aldose epimerase family protein [Falsihalocynthiibacter sp. SS001]|uniref:aldose epimerase family protein n=1 Tax=Falsihalocynthiibacter sp. SS001 TaxID=3349698 RepID=UPI0036D22148